VLVHDFRIAAALREHVAAESDEPLMILTGHDHKQHVDRSGNVVEIDGGTLGAGGVVDIGKALAGLAALCSRLCGITRTARTCPAVIAASAS